MMGGVRKVMRVAAALLFIAAAAPATAAAGGFEPCGEDSAVLCGKVPVPLDRTGKVTGNLDLYVERARARDLPAKAAGGAPRGALFALAGGPGQPATQFTSDFIFAFGERRLGRDIVTFDQRGTGRSGLLRCPEIERVVLLSRYPDAAERCAQRLGDRRGLYTTSDSVDDMEAIRQAIGVDRIAIYGASYGTKVALAYAARYPEHVERLILDSVVTPEGPDPLYRDTFAAMPRVLRASCGGQCDWTTDAGEDLAALGDQLAVGPARGSVVDRRGRAKPQSIGLSRLFFLMLGGDFAPRIRASLPSAVYNARRGDPAQLLRLATLAETGAEPSNPRDFSAAIFTATICEEVAFPWQRGAPFDDRERQAGERIAALGEGAFGPFGPGAVTETDLIQLCRRWAEAASRAAVDLAATARRAGADPGRRARPAHTARGRAAGRGAAAERDASDDPRHRALDARLRRQLVHDRGDRRGSCAAGRSRPRARTRAARSHRTRRRPPTWTRSSRCAAYPRPSGGCCRRWS